MTERTWTISDIDGKNQRTTTLEQFRADLDARAVYTKRISDAMRRGDMPAMAKAQAEMRSIFS